MYTVHMSYKHESQTLDFHFNMQIKCENKNVNVVNVEASS